MKIIVCSNVYPPRFVGGAELIAHQQAKALRDAGNEIIVFSGEIGGRLKRYECVREKYDTLDVFRIGLSHEDYRPERVNFFHRRVEERFIALLDGFSPDVVHMHNIVGLSAGLIGLSKRAGAKTVVTLHDYWGFCPRNTLLDNSGKICLDYDGCDKCAPGIRLDGGLWIPVRMRKDYIDLQSKEVDLFISPSGYLANVYRNAGFPGERIAVIWNGVDVRRFESIRRKRERNRLVRFSFIGHFGAHKGIRVLCDALALLGTRYRFRVNFVGTGEELHATRRRIVDLGLRKSVKFWGMVSRNRIKRVYRETDVLVLPSVCPENHPGVITESMASHIPVIATRAGGIPELVEEGRTGFLVEPGDARQLARKMEFFISDPKSIRRFGDDAFKRIEHDTFETHAEKRLKLYRDTTVISSTNTETRSIVACAGRGLAKIHTDALHLFMDLVPGNSCRFVLYDWLTPDRICEATVCWVLAETGFFEEALYASEHGVLLLVPEKNTKLKSYCSLHRKGLYYGDPYEAALCLKHLIMKED